MQSGYFIYLRSQRHTESEEHSTESRGAEGYCGEGEELPEKQVSK